MYVCAGNDVAQFSNELRMHNFPYENNDRNGFHSMTRHNIEIEMKLGQIKLKTEIEHGKSTQHIERKKKEQSHLSEMIPRKMNCNFQVDQLESQSDSIKV